MRNGVFASRLTRPAFQTQRIVPNTASAKPPPPSRAADSMKGSNGPQPSGSRVVVRSVPVVQKPEPAPSKQALSSQTKSASATPIAAFVLSMPDPQPPSKASTPPPCSPPETTWSPLPQPQTLSPEARSLSARTPGKKNPGASLFMPKHRAYSQLPRGVQSKS